MGEGGCDIITNPNLINTLAVSVSFCDLSLFRADINTLPFFGNSIPAPNWALKNALSKLLSFPITSPVERISGPNKVSTPGNLLNGNTASLTQKYLIFGDFKSKFINGSPAITRAAIAAIGLFTAFATKGTVLDARGLTSRTKIVSFFIAN